MTRPAAFPFQALIAALLATLLAACASAPTPTMRRDGVFVPGQSASTDGQPSARDQAGVSREPLEAPDVDPTPVIRRGTGQTINRDAASAPLPNFGASSGEASFNFEGESLHAVVKAILGDMLGQNFTIAPGVQGNVTLNVQKVSSAEAFTLLEQVLGWNNARMVYVNGIYNVVAADTPLAGTVAPRTGPASSVRGFETRVVPLRYISATEMKKVLEPYARPNAIVNADAGRNVITVAGTRAELENYLRTIEIFDVDWMSSMSVGVFPLQSGRATKVVSDLEKVFGEQGKSPVAGMFRFLPLEGANAIMVITPQPDYLDDIREWLERIDSAGGGVRLFSYELKYITAKDLAQQLAQVYGARRSGGGDSSGSGVSLMPGLEPTTIQDGGIDGDGMGKATSDGGDGFSSNAMGSGSGMDGSSGSSSGMGEGASLGQREGGNTSVSFEVDGSQVGVAAVEETNSILVRSTAGAWRSIKEVIEKLDVMPMQVHIEAQIAQVQLRGQLDYGVNWFFENAVSDPVASGGAGLPNAAGRDIWGDIRGNVGTGGIAWTFLGRNAAAIITALDTVTDVKMLSTPSVFTRNNTEASFNVGSNIPINSVSFNPVTGTEGTFSQVQYLQTGTILKVRPRATRDGTVFLDLVQEISSPSGTVAGCEVNCNPQINTRKLRTRAAVQSGETVMLAGLIEDSVERGSAGLPGLSRLPVIGGLFGTQGSDKMRNETIILITPTIIRNGQEARDLTDEYGRRFRAMEPLRQQPGRD